MNSIISNHDATENKKIAVPKVEVAKVNMPIPTSLAYASKNRTDSYLQAERILNRDFAAFQKLFQSFPSGVTDSASNTQATAKGCDLPAPFPSPTAKLLFTEQLIPELRRVIIEASPQATTVLGSSTFTVEFLLHELMKIHVG